MKKREDMSQLPLPLEPRPVAIVDQGELSKPRLTLVLNGSPPVSAAEQSNRDEDARALARIVGYSRSLGW